MAENLRDLFEQYFELVAADDPLLREQVFRLRYDVYCAELGFENPLDFPDLQETDEFDARSEHYLIRHRKSGTYAATTRLILPDFQDPSSSFPMEQHATMMRGGLPSGIPREQLGEISRFCIARQFRRRCGESGHEAGVDTGLERLGSLSETERRAAPHILLGLVACLVRSSARHGITHWFALMEPAMHRLLSFFGIRFVAVGPAISYCGTRYPYVMDLGVMLREVASRNPSAAAFLTDQGRFWGETPKWRAPDSAEKRRAGGYH